MYRITNGIQSTPLAPRSRVNIFRRQMGVRDSGRLANEWSYFNINVNNI